MFGACTAWIAAEVDGTVSVKREVTVSSLRRTPARFSLVDAVTAMAVEALHEKSVTPQADDDALRVATDLEPTVKMHTRDNSA